MASSVKMFPHVGKTILPEGVKILMPPQLKVALAKIRRQQAEYMKLWEQNRRLRQENAQLKARLQGE